MVDAPVVIRPAGVPLLVTPGGSQRCVPWIFLLEALEHALFAAKDQVVKGLSPHSDRGSQHVSIRCTEDHARLT